MRPVAKEPEAQLEIRHAAKPGGPFKKVLRLNCRRRDWPALKKYLLDTDREVVEED